MNEQGTNLASFFTNHFFETLLQKYNSKPINVLSFKAGPAVAAGNNYCCVVYRVRVEYEVGKIVSETSLIIKTPLTDGKAKEFIAELGMIDKECTIYEELLPLMDNVLNKKITPKYYPCTHVDTVILQDLKDQGYVMCDRLEQLDFDHCNIFMKTIAIFHATSVYIKKQNPDLIVRVGKELMYKVDLNESFRKYFKDKALNFATVLEEWGEFDDFVDLYKNNSDKLLNQVIVVHNTKKHLRVLNHGDAWTNNMLFKYDESGKVIDMKLIDLQNCKFSTPALDLILFTLSSVQTDVKEHRLSKLYDTYLESLNSTLESLDCDERLTANELQDELKFSDCFSLCLLLGFIPMVLNDRDNVMGIDDLLNLANESKIQLFMKVFNSERFKPLAKTTLIQLRERNILSSLL